MKQVHILVQIPRSFFAGDQELRPLGRSQHIELYFLLSFLFSVFEPNTFEGPEVASVGADLACVVWRFKKFERERTKR